MEVHKQMTTLVIIRENKTTKYPLDIDAKAVRNKYGTMLWDNALDLSEDDAVLTVNTQASTFNTIMGSLRIAAELSQVELAEMAELTPQYISLVENGKKIPKDSTIIKLFDVLLIKAVGSYLEVAPMDKSPDTSTNPDSSSTVYNRNRKSADVLKEKDFDKYRKDIHDALDDILYSADDDMVRALKTIVEKISDYNYAKNSMEQSDTESREHHSERCMKYAQDIYNELEYQISKYETLD